jgi:hypothetical protein
MGEIEDGASRVERKAVMRYAKQYIVGLDIRSRRLKVADMAAALGVQPSHGLDRGEIGFRGKRYRESMWRLDSGLPKSRPICEHLSRLRHLLPASVLRRGLRKMGTGTTVALCIGVMHKTYTCSIALTPEDLNSFPGVTIEISCYPLTSWATKDRCPVCGTLVGNGWTTTKVLDKSQV